MCLVLSVAVAILVSVRVVRIREAEDPVAALLSYSLPIIVFAGIIVLGVALRSWVRGVLGVADTERTEEDDSASEKPMPPDPEVDDVSEPTVCLVCGTRIPAGDAECSQCGWTYRPK